MSSAQKKPKAPAVAQAIAILRCLADHGRPLGVTAVARAVSLGPSSCFNILKTLEGEGFVAFDAATKTYTFGSGAAAMSRRARDLDNVFDLARPDLGALARELGATCALWRMVGGSRLLLLGSETSHEAARIDLEVGQRLPLLAGAAGRSIVAHMRFAPGELEPAFREVRWASAPSFATYVAELEETRRRGWALDDGAYLRGVASVACALSDGIEPPRLSLSALFFSGLPAEGVERVGQATRRAAEELAGRIYGRASRTDGG